MRIHRQTVSVLALLIMVAASSSHAIIGFGAHYGIDYSLSMPDSVGEAVKFGSYESMKNNLGAILNAIPGGAGITIPDPLLIDRTGFDRHPFNLGGKVFIDVVPVLDIIEASFNIGAWQYDGQLRYLNVDSLNATQLPGMVNGNFPYTAVPLTLEAADLSFFGMSKTPYAKMQFDLSVRKKLKIPVIDKIIRISGGGGVSAHFATPVLTESFLIDALDLDSDFDFADLATLFIDQEAVQKKVVNKIIEEFSEPTIGAHIVAGVHVKVPVFPIGIYVDGKYMIPFGPLDEGAELSGFGLLVNAGITLGL